MAKMEGILHISEQQIAQLLTPRDALDAVRAAHRALASGDSSNVVRSRAMSPGMSLHTMSAVSSGLGQAAAKLYTSTRSSVQSLVLLYDRASGNLLATIEANELGRLRTAAASVVAAIALAAPPLPVLAVIGAGFQARGVVRAYSAAADKLGIERIIVAARREEQLDALRRECADECARPLSTTTAVDMACREAAVIVCATTASRPFITADCIPGVRHICALGSNSLARAELHPRVVTAAHTVVVDDKDAARREAGDLLAPLETGHLSWNRIRELGEVLTSGTPPSTNFSIFCSQGLAVQDLFLAHLAYQRATGANSRIT